MRRKSIQVVALVAVAAAALLFAVSGCYFDSLGGANTAKAALSVSMKQPVGTVTSIALVISGPNMPSIARTLATTDTEVSLEVPAGPDRTFTVLVNTADMTFKGETTIDLVAGESTTVSVRPVLAVTKLVFPDALGGKVIQIDDISGSGWATLSAGSISFPGFQPYDVDFDNRGRIYISNYGFTTGQDVVLRVDSIGATSYETIVDSGTFSPIVAIAIDRELGYLYYATDTTLKRCNLDGSAVTTLTTTGIGIIRGMALGRAGILYIAGANGAGGQRVFKYNLATQAVVAEYSANLNNPWDVLYKPPYVYVANYYGSDGYKIIRLDENMLNPVGYGINAPTLPNTDPGNFYGPARFVAILNKKITLIDDTDLNHKLVSMDDILGTNWQTFPTTGNGSAFFTFYSC